MPGCRVFGMMEGMDWATRRKLVYGGGLALFILIAVSVPLYFYLDEPPSCTDNKQNQEEAGVDCGGPCDALCPEQAREPIIHWQRPFKVADGVYDVVAFAENVNAQGGAREVIYQFKLYDEDNILIAEKFGKTYMAPNEELAIFEGGIRTGDRVPERVFFEFAPDIDWERVTYEDRPKPELTVRNQNLSDLDERPRLQAQIGNQTPLPVSDISVAAVLFGSDGNAIAVSATHIDEIPQNGSENAVFTWPESFDETPVQINIIPRVNPFSL